MNGITVLLPKEFLLASLSRVSAGKKVLPAQFFPQFLAECSAKED